MSVCTHLKSSNERRVRRTYVTRPLSAPQPAPVVVIALQLYLRTGSRCAHMPVTCAALGDS
eukprot:8164104-Pyramimonas_sp.AAC.4